MRLPDPSRDEMGAPASVPVSSCETRQLTMSEHLAHYEALVQRLERERDEYAKAADYLMLVCANHLDQRIQGAPVNIKTMDPIRLILGWQPCRLGRTEGEFQAALAEFGAVRAGLSGGEAR